MARPGGDKPKVPGDSSHLKEKSLSSKEHSLHSHEETPDSYEETSDSNEETPDSYEEASYSNEETSGSNEETSDSYEDSSNEKGATCKDHKKNQGETDIDCGGTKCPKCADRKICKANRDCISGICKDKICAERSTKSTKKTTTIAVTTTVPVTTTTSTVTTTASTEPATTATSTVPTTASTEPVTTATSTVPTTASAEPVTTATSTVPTTASTVVTTTEAPVIITTISPNCEFECKNGGTCTDYDQCTCTTDFSGPTCEVQSVGLCLNDETFGTEPILLITFGNGSSQYSTSTPADFDFSTTYQQKFESATNDGMFSFINLVYNHFDAWHTNATDHSEDNNGYMYLVNANYEPGQFYNGRVDNLCIGLRYEFSVYLANLCKPSGRINPNILFEVRSVDGNVLLAQLESGDVVERDRLTWEKYGFSFIASSSSVNLLMISNARGGDGNDLVIDDIALRVCAHRGSGFCPSN
jgi:hypothetical protein